MKNEPGSPHLNRVIHVVPAVSEEASGPSYTVVRLCESLIEQGLDVTLAALDWSPMPSPPPFLRTFPLGFGPRRLGRSPAMRKWLLAQIGSGNVRILHNHGMWQMSAVYPGWAARSARASLVVTPRGAFSDWAMQHGSRLKSVFWPILQRPALEAAACFHATAESEYIDIRRLGFRQPVAIIPNGIDIPELPLKPESASRTLLFLGRISRIKGLDVLLPAWRAVQDRFPDWRLVIAGSDEGYHGKSGYLEEVRILCRSLHLQRVEFVGELRGRAKLEAYRTADLFVLPTHSENFGVAAAEALAAGTPAIVTKGAPWAGLVGRGAGWWIEMGVDPLVACLEDALRQPGCSLAAMGMRGRAWMKEEYSWAQLAWKMSEMYRWLAGERESVPEWLHTD